MRLADFSHYDDPKRAQRVYMSYVPDPNKLILTRQDEVEDAVRDNSTADGLDLALDQILADVEVPREDVNCFKGFQNRVQL